jgi:predicted unusual protein kinase regulating ubiquinone biosynthesis (AarF/ABC1/UbiB family)
MNIQDIRQRIQITVKKVSEQDKPNIRLIKECIDLIKEHGLEEELEKDLNNLKMMHTMGSLLETSNSLLNEDEKDFEDESNAKQFTFTMTQIDGHIETDLKMQNCETLELLGCIALMERAILKVLKENEKED